MSYTWVMFLMAIPAVLSGDDATKVPPKVIPCFKPELYKTFEACHNQHHQHIPDEIDAHEKEKLQLTLIECTLTKMEAFDKNGQMQPDQFEKYLTGMAADHVNKEEMGIVVKKCTGEFHEASKERGLMVLMECLGHNMAEVCRQNPA